MSPRDKTACQTFPCKCKICISSIESDVYNKKKIQMFVVNMTFISSREVKNCIFHSCLRHEWNIHFFTSLDEIKVIFTPNIWISSILWFLHTIIFGVLGKYLFYIRLSWAVILQLKHIFIATENIQYYAYFCPCRSEVLPFVFGQSIWK